MHFNNILVLTFQTLSAKTIIIGAMVPVQCVYSNLQDPLHNNVFRGNLN